MERRSTVDSIATQPLRGPSEEQNCPENNIIKESIVASQAFDISEQDDLQMLECQLLYACHLCPDVTCSGQQELEEHMMSIHHKTHGQSMSELVDEMPDNNESQSRVVVEEVPARNNSFDCKQCSHKANSTASLALHITTEHMQTGSGESSLQLPPKKRVWACSKCGVVFGNPRSLGVHRKLHHSAPLVEDEASKDIQSNEEEDSDCVSTINVVIETDMFLPTKGSEVAQYGRGKRKKKKPKHLDGPDNEGILDCPHCSEILASDTALNEHISYAHSFQCDKCGIKFASGKACMKHLCREAMLFIDINRYYTNIDNENPYYTCLCCEHNYTDPAEFHEHLVWQGTNLQCQVCKGYCVTVDELEEHVVTCSGGNGVDQSSLSHTCQYCSILLVDEQALQHHLAIHTDYKCNSCGHQYWSRYGLQRHLLLCDQSQLDRVQPVFACLQCEAVFATQHGLEYHNRNHTELTYDCKDCHMSFPVQEEFEVHECKGDLHSCDICKDAFKSSKALASHYLTHTLHLDCLLCKKTFHDKEELIRHSLECSAKDMLDKTGRIDCAHCEACFTDVAQYKSHLSVHTHYHECKHCQRRFRKKQQLTLHSNKCPLKSDKPKRPKKSVSRSIHHISSEVHHTCPICGRTFVRKDYFLSHQCRGEDGRIIPRPDNLQLVEDPKPSSNIVCYQCGKIFSSQSNLTKHLKLHGEKDNTCVACGKTFHQVHAMRLHYDTVHTDRLKVACNQCKRVFRNKYSLHQHMKQFHSESIALYACEICEKKFRQKGNMMKHMLAHDATRHYSCEFCDKSFRYPEQLKRHLVLHAQGRSLACHLCDRRFIIQYELNKHLKEMHSNKLYVCAVCGETCRWKHTMRRHIKRKHQQIADMADSSAYLMSLQKDIEQCQVVNRLLMDGQGPASAPLVISMESLTTEQMVELAEEQIGQAGEDSSTMQLYTGQGHLPENDVRKLSDVRSQQLSMNNAQHFTINLSNGRAILTQVNLNDERVNAPSLLRSQVASEVAGVNGLTEQTDSRIVIDQTDHHVSLPENTVILSNDGSIAYSNDSRPEVNFSDITHIAESAQTDTNKMMFFNLIPGGGESSVTQ
ncbi:zinc finger protein 585A-like [Watersipora subatra]|uniref:zinc finger protein 585A-like n=1 Tax=Watersipora subatra TaxID=2589382 RepID=UPI00355B2AFE